MNLIQSAPLWLAVLAAVAMVAGAIEDIIRLRISNVTCLAVILCALVAMAIAGFPAALWQNAVVFFAILAAGTIAFSRKLLGGGDVKLLAATGLWVNLSTAPWLLAAIFVFGGLVALVYLVTRPFRRQVLGRKERTQVPYGLAIAAGTFFILGMQYAAGPPTAPVGPLPAIKGVPVPRS
jgi:prepilin peptidase CpaA